MVDQRRLRKKLLKQAKKLGFSKSRRGGFSVKFLQEWIKSETDKEEQTKRQIREAYQIPTIKDLIHTRQQLKKQGASRIRIQQVQTQISELEKTKKSRGTKERQVRHQQERRQRARET